MKIDQIMVPLVIVPVAYWAYEHAFASEIITKVNDHNIGTPETQKQAEEIYWKLNKLFEVNPDNKQTFQVRVISGDYSGRKLMLYLTWHDNIIYIGQSVRAYRGGTMPKPDKTYTDWP